jgi:hypothetical protein
MKYRSGKLLALAVIICFIPLSQVFPQKGAASIIGIIIDPNGAVIPGAAVTARIITSDQRKPRAEFNTYSDDEGHFSFPEIPPGLYEIRVNAEAVNYAAVKKVRVRELSAAPITITCSIVESKGCIGRNLGSGVISDRDRSEILRQALQQLVHSKMLMGDQLKGQIVLSTQNLKREWVPEVAGLQLALMSSHEIQKKADHENDFLYVSFSRFKVNGMCAVISFSNTWAVGKRSTMVYLSGGGFEYEFHKESGKWVGRFLSGWIS